MSHSQAILPPRVPAVWLTVSGDDCAAAARQYLAQGALDFQPYFECPLPSGDASSHAVSIEVMSKLVNQLKQIPGHSGLLRHMESLVERLYAAQDGLDTPAEFEAAVVENMDALAALRRISREGASGSALVDQSARAANRALDALGYRTVLVINAELIDRPSLRFLARGCLLSPPDSMNWLWVNNPLPEPSDPVSLEQIIEDLPLTSRHSILRTIKAILKPQAAVLVQSTLHQSHRMHIDQRDIGRATKFLTNLNYDACALWAAARAGDFSPDYCRFTALLLSNLGLHKAATELLERGCTASSHPSLRAQFWFMSGLIWSKRLNHIERANACFERAEAELERADPDDPGDPALEWAWVQNGRAMTTILAARRERIPVRQVFPVAYGHLKNAFDRVRHGRTPNRSYLRFNLVGNMSTLMEISGNDRAVSYLAQASNELIAGGSGSDWLAHLKCLKAARMARLGNVRGAASIFAETRLYTQKADQPIFAEILGRSLATARFKAGDIDAAGELFEECLVESRVLRSRTGVEVHATGIAVCHLLRGDKRAAQAVLEDMASEEDVWCLSKSCLEAGDLSQLKIKENFPTLPMSIPEVDLEGTVRSTASVLYGKEEM